MGLERRHWILLGVAVAAVSVSSLLARLAQAEGVPSLVVSFYRLLFATLMLLPFALRRRAPGAWRLGPRRLFLFAGVGFLLAAHFATWVTSLEHTTVASSTVLVTTEALWVPLGAAFLLHETVTRRMWTGIAVALSGSLLLVAGDLGETRFEGRALLGDFLAFAGALAASLYFLAGRRLRQRHDLLVYATIVYGFSTVFLFAMVLVRNEPLGPYSQPAFLWLFLFAFFPMILGHTLINYLLRWVPPHYVSTSILAEPVVSAVLAATFLGEWARPLVVVGGAVVILGIIVATTGSTADRLPAAPPPT